MAGPLRAGEKHPDREFECWIKSRVWGLLKQTTDKNQNKTKTFFKLNKTGSK